MEDLLAGYLERMLAMEEAGYMDAAVILADKLLETFPEQREEILNEKAKMEFRNEDYKNALEDFIKAYECSNNQEIFELVLEAYCFPNQEIFVNQYQKNIQQLWDYPHYRNPYEIEELKVFPVWQEEEYLIYADSERKQFGRIVRMRNDYTEFENIETMCINSLWMEEILACEKNSRVKKVFMDANLPLYLVYDKAFWLLFLQLYDLHELLDKKRVVFLIGELSVDEYFSELFVLFPKKVVNNGFVHYYPILEKRIQAYTAAVERNKKEIAEYYKGREKEINEHIKSGKPRILFLTSRFTTALQYHTRDVMQAAERIGCETRLLIEKDALHRINNGDILEEIASFKPDIFFQIDYFRQNHSSIPKAIVFITWIQDRLPQSTANEKIVSSLEKRDIVISSLISDLQGKCWGMNLRNALKAPFSANQSIYKIWDLSEEEKVKYSCDICYVANASDYRKKVADYKQSLPKEMQDDFQLVIDVYFRLMEDEVHFFGYERNLEVLKYILNELKINWKEHAIRLVAIEITQMISYMRYKSLLIEWLIDAGYTNIKLYGKDWGNDEKFRPYAMGTIENGEKLSKALNAAKIVLGIHPHVSMPAKVIEAISSGAFCMTNHIEEADMASAREYFIEGEEFIYFYGKQDFLEKIQYYLEHEEERNRIVEAGLARIKKELTYERMLERIFSEISEAFKNNTEQIREEYKDGK